MWKCQATLESTLFLVRAISLFVLDLKLRKTAHRRRAHETAHYIVHHLYLLLWYKPANVMWNKKIFPHLLRCCWQTHRHTHTHCVKHSIHFCVMNLLSFRNSHNDFFLSLKGVSCYSKAKNTWNALACIGITHRLRSCQKYQTNKVKKANRHESWGGHLFYKADIVVLYFISPANGLKKTFASVCFMSSEAIQQQICFPYLWLHSGEQNTFWWMFLRTPYKNEESEAKHQTWGFSV